MQKIKAFYIGATNWIEHIWNKYVIHTLLFIISLGNADTLRRYLITTGATDTWQLTAAIYCTELLTVLATKWGTVGLAISTVLFFVSMHSIKSVYGVDWLGHTYFSVAIYCGAVGVYFKDKGYKDIEWAFKKDVKWQR